MKLLNSKNRLKHAGMVTPSGQVLEVKSRRMPVLTAAGRARLEAKAKQFNPKAKYPRFTEI